MYVTYSLHKSLIRNLSLKLPFCEGWGLVNETQGIVSLRLNFPFPSSGGAHEKV